MATSRGIRRVFSSKPVVEGAGVHLKRVFGFNELPIFDPFLLLDDFRSDYPRDYEPGFPWHPHRGIETITYVLKGQVNHGDSLGNNGRMGPGDVQWMTAGSGIIHEEMPEGDEQGRMYGFQLWANLPAAQKMMGPRYRDVKSDEIPEVNVGDARVKVIAGEVSGVQGPVRDVVIDPEYLDVKLQAGATFRHTTVPGHTVFAYVFDGDGHFGGSEDVSGNGTVVLFDDGEEAQAVAGQSGARFLLISGMPLREPIAWYGPIVMNTNDELQVAFEEHRKGTFIKDNGKDKRE